MKTVILSEPTNVKIIYAGNNYEGLGSPFLPLFANNIFEGGWIMCLRLSGFSGWQLCF